jgi:hypothetical protein
VAILRTIRSQWGLRIASTTLVLGAKNRPFLQIKTVFGPIRMVRELLGKNCVNPDEQVDG